MRPLGILRPTSAQLSGDIPSVSVVTRASTASYYHLPALTWSQRTWLTGHFPYKERFFFGYKMIKMRGLFDSYAGDDLSPFPGVLPGGFDTTSRRSGVLGLCIVLPQLSQD